MVEGGIEEVRAEGAGLLQLRSSPLHQKHFISRPDTILRHQFLCFGIIFWNAGGRDGVAVLILRGDVFAARVLVFAFHALTSLAG